MISDRIRFYQSALFSPSETLDYSIVTVAGQSIYSFNNYVALRNVQSIVHVRMLQGSIWLILSRVPWYSEILDIDVVSPPFQTLPAYWATYGMSLRLYPTPSQAYPLELMCSAAIPEPVADTDTNFWTQDAATLIIEAACAEICRTTLNDEARATQHQFCTERESRMLQSSTVRLRGPATIRPHF